MTMIGQVQLEELRLTKDQSDDTIYAVTLVTDAMLSQKNSVLVSPGQKIPVL
jgi:hypothetical protein